MFSNSCYMAISGCVGGKLYSFEDKKQTEKKVIIFVNIRPSAHLVGQQVGPEGSHTKIIIIIMDTENQQTTSHLFHTDIYWWGKHVLNHLFYMAISGCVGGKLHSIKEKKT